MALKGSASKSGWMPDHRLDQTVLADICFGADLSSYHFDSYFSEQKK